MTRPRRADRLRMRSWFLAAFSFALTVSLLAGPAAAEGPPVSSDRILRGERIFVGELLPMGSVTTAGGEAASLDSATTTPEGWEELTLFGGSFADLRSAWPGFAEGPLRGEGVAARSAAELRGELARRLHGDPEARFFGWLAPAGQRARVLAEEVEVKRARLRLDLRLELDAAERTRAANGGGRALGRALSVWVIPHDEPLLLAWLTVVGVDGLERFRYRYVGPWAGPERGEWVEDAPARPADILLRAPDPAPAVDALARMARAFGRAPDVGSGQELPVEVLARGQHALHVSKPQRRILRTQAELVREWERLHAEAIPRPPPPRLREGQELVVVAYLGEVPSSGYAVEIESARRRLDGVLEVRIRVIEPSPGTVNLPVISHPYVLVRVRVPSQVRVEIRPEGVIGLPGPPGPEPEAPFR